VVGQLSKLLGGETGNDRYIYIDGREIAFIFSDELFNSNKQGEEIKWKKN